MAYPAVFLDRDGTINEEVGYLTDPEKLVLIPQAGKAIRLLNQHGFKTVVITNQSGVARGYFSESLVNQIHQRMRELLKEEGAHIDGIYYCPHHPEIGITPYRQKCRCRKPDIGLVEEAVRDLDIDCSKSYVIGDRVIDIQFAFQIGAKGVLVLTGYGKEELEYLKDQSRGKPDHIALDLYRAVEWILSQEGGR